MPPLARAPRQKRVVLKINVHFDRFSAWASYACLAYIILVKSFTAVTVSIGLRHLQHFRLLASRKRARDVVIPDTAHTIFSFLPKY